MTMENQEWNRKIWQNVRNKIVVSNLEREESMKLKQRKQAISMCAVAIILLSGSFFTVNAATDGKLVEEIKNKYEEMIVVRIDENKYRVTDAKEGNDENGDKTITYTVQSVDGEEEISIEANKEVVERENLQVELQSNEEEMTMLIQGK